MSLDLRSMMSLDASWRQSPQYCGPNDHDTPIQSQSLASSEPASPKPASPGSHTCLSSTSHSPSPLGNPDNLASPAQQLKPASPESPCPRSHTCGLSSTSRSPSPLGNPDNLTSSAQQIKPPEPHIPVVPIEYRLIPGAWSSTPVDNSALNHPQSNASQHSTHRMEHKIRGLDQIMHWFDSRGCEPLLAPPPCESLECGDLYIHQSLSAPNTCQIWIWSAKESWEDAQENQAHPLLPMHRLWFGATREPRWVTQKTISTYKGCLKVSGKLKVVSVQAKSETIFCCLSVQALTCNECVGACRPLLPYPHCLGHRSCFFTPRTT